MSFAVEGSCTLQNRGEQPMVKKIAVYDSYIAKMPVKLRYWKKRRDGIKQRYWKTKRGYFKRAEGKGSYEFYGTGRDLCARVKFGLFLQDLYNIGPANMTKPMIIKRIMGSGEPGAGVILGL